MQAFSGEQYPGTVSIERDKFEVCKIKNKFNKYSAENTVFQRFRPYLILTTIYRQLAGCYKRNGKFIVKRT